MKKSALLNSVLQRSSNRTSHDQIISAFFTNVEQLMSSQRFNCVSEGLSIFLDATNPNISGYRVAESVATILLSGTTIASNIVLSLTFKECWPTTVNMTKDDMRLDESMLRDYAFTAF
jgi:hypothetical protein